MLLLPLMIVISAQAAGNAIPTPMERAKELVTANKPELALAALSTFHPSQGELSQYHYAFAQALVQSNQLHDSIPHFRMAFIYAVPGKEREQLLFERAEVYVKMGYNAEAAVCFDVLLKQFPNSALSQQAELGIAESRYRLGQYREALSHYEKAGTSLQASYGKANALQNLGRTAEAHEIYRALLGKDANITNSSAETIYNMAENHRQSGDLNNAKIYFASVNDESFKYKAALGLGRIAMDDRGYEPAEKHFRTAAESPDRMVRRQAILYQAEIAAQTGRQDQAEAALLDIRRNYPYGSQYDTAALMLARIYKAKGKYPEALALLKELIYRRTPSSAALDELEAILLDAAGRDKDEFVKLWSTGGRWLLEPSRSQSLVKIAQGLRYSGKPFIEVCTWLIKYGPEEEKTAARLLLADFYAGLGDMATAFGYLKRSKVKNHSDDALRVLARIHTANNNPINAYESITALQQVRNADILLLFEAIHAIKDTKYIRSAVLFLDKQFQKTPGTQAVYVRLADMLVDAGLQWQALRYYKEAVEQASKAGTPEGKASSDIEWAHYRIAGLSSGEDRLRSLKLLETAKGAAGRFAAAELKGEALKRKVQ